MEIERKFLIKEKPPIIAVEHFHTKQAYISVDPEVCRFYSIKSARVL